MIIFVRAIPAPAAGLGPAVPQKIAPSISFAYLNEKAGVDIKKTHLGHVQRGGSPTMADRILATRFAIKAVEELLKEDSVSSAIGIKENKIQAFPFAEALACKKQVNEELYNAINILSK